jgi:hypothetical protein
MVERCPQHQRQRATTAALRRQPAEQMPPSRSCSATQQQPIAAVRALLAARQSPGIAVMVRRAKNVDAAAIAEVQVSSSNAAYRGLLPDDVLEHSTVSGHKSVESTCWSRRSISATRSHLSSQAAVGRTTNRETALTPRVIRAHFSSCTRPTNSTTTASAKPYTTRRR